MLDEKQRKILDTDYQKVNITEEFRNFIKENAKKYPHLYLDTPVNIRMGKFYTDEGLENRIEKVLDTPLPGIEEPKKKSLFFSKSKK